MKRSLAALVGLALLLVCARVYAQPLMGPGRSLNQRVVWCSTTVAHVIGGNESRVSVTIINVGTTHISVGNDQVGTYPFTLHVGASLSLNGYLGGINCLTSQPAQTIQVLEETR